MKSAIQAFVLTCIAIGIHMVVHAEDLAATYATSPLGFVLSMFAAYVITYASMFCVCVAVRIAVKGR